MQKCFKKMVIICFYTLSFFEAAQPMCEQNKTFLGQVAELGNVDQPATEAQQQVLYQPLESEQRLLSLLGAVFLQFRWGMVDEVQLVNNLFTLFTQIKFTDHVLCYYDQGVLSVTNQIRNDGIIINKKIALLFDCLSLKGLQILYEKLARCTHDPGIYRLVMLLHRFMIYKEFGFVRCAQQPPNNAQERSDSTQPKYNENNKKKDRYYCSYLDCTYEHAIKRGYKTEQALDQHINNVHTQKYDKIFCTCGQGFNSKSTYRHHVNKCHRLSALKECKLMCKMQKKFVCRLCSQEFFIEASFFKHIQVNHQTSQSTVLCDVFEEFCEDVNQFGKKKGDLFQSYSCYFSLTSNKVYRC